MNVRETTPPSQTDTLSFELDLRHPRATVWRALTDPALLSEWLLPVVGFALEPGAEFRFQAPEQPGWDGRVDCRMSEVEPMDRLRWTWVVGDLDTVLTFTLAPHDGAGTRLTVVQSGFTSDQKRNFGGARYGWRMMTEKLVALLEEAA
ncbi:MAG: SRPBCC domain-containing protein [Myxococcota bacterium]